MQHIPIIVLVSTCAGFRVFTTKSFSIRTLIVHLQRYCGKFDILSLSYGEYHGKSEWSQELNYIKSDVDVSSDESKEELLKNHGYRDALNIYYIQCGKKSIYPSKSPFRGVKTDLPESEYIYGDIKHPIFISDNENDLENPSDILTTYEGRHVTKMVHGEEKSGYILTSSRRIIAKDEEDV